MVLILFTFPASASFVESNCTAAREYVTTLEFLRSQTALDLAEADARRVALEVSSGCTGAGERFIRTIQLLSKAGIASAEAIAVGRELAGRTDRETETFVTIFQHAFLEDYLDLDLLTSLRMAKSLSTEFEGDVLAVRDDFKTLVQFCTDPDRLPMSKPRCADFAVRMIRKGQAFSGGVSRSFIEAFDFMRSPKLGPGLPSGRALEIAEELVAAGPGAGDNFIQGYRYAIGKKGLALDVDAALTFARSLAAKTIKSPISIKKTK